MRAWSQVAGQCLSERGTQSWIEISESQTYSMSTMEADVQEMIGGVLPIRVIFRKDGSEGVMHRAETREVARTGERYSVTYLPRV